MKLKTLSTAILLATVPMTGAFAAALDRSGQSIAAFLQPGNYFEAGISVLDPTVEGQEAGTSATTRDINDMAGDYYFPSAALKLQLTDNFSFGLLYDQPFGADATYKGNNVFVANAQDRILSSLPITTSAIGGTTSGSTSVEVDTQNLSVILGFQPTEQFNIYGGGVYQTIKGNVSLRGSAYSVFNGYDANIKEDSSTGWLAGLAFQIPEIALKASLTYRSEIDHKLNIDENASLAPVLGAAAGAIGAQLGGLGLPPQQIGAIGNAIGGFVAANSASGETKITTPQSVNLDFQTGIMADTVAFANVRWVDWSSFSIRPYKFGLASEAVGPLVQRPNGFNLVEYSDDQISATVGVGRKLSEQWAGNVSVGWDSGAGNPVSTLGPTEGYWNVGLGVQFSPAPNYFIAGGVKYFMLGDAKAQTGAQAGGNEYVANFEDNDAIAYGLKMGYRF
ncbi:outer membrane protein transport protein [Acinetobacter terrestris]|uniref:Outer membrane protein transport protein n=1 Tax=Acinetobacter terrestris TaxID=2529843 RepID=A0AAW6USX2_9GAMM|nr:outer membrane protein transport protein [Acinetobacter terrestris]MDK1682729.1 outer membrane protein transport protein [Acinetobacter terrestris]